MKQGFISLEEVFEQWKLLSIEILHLDFDNEDKLDRLMELQNDQEKLRQSAEVYLNDHKHSRSPALNLLIQECIELEKQVSEKLVLQREIAANHLSNLHAGKRARASYQGNSTQVDGYFVDKYK